MDTREKNAVMKIIDDEGSYTVECVKRLKSECHIPTKDTQHTRICCQMAKDNHPEHLDMGLPVALRTAPELLGATALVQARPVLHGLPTLQLKPDGKKGDELLNHMCLMARRCTGGAER